MSEHQTNDARDLVRRLSRAAAMLDKSLHGPPVQPARDVDYALRQAKLAKQAEKELMQLRERLADMTPK